MCHEIHFIVLFGIFNAVYFDGEKTKFMTYFSRNERKYWVKLFAYQRRKKNQHEALNFLMPEWRTYK